ncbi:GH92 family glycosyl hydrolase [Flavihumibacter fluvii]|uniref:GH92 family glycosyl hydrolase n=1 Tax=Flavihumibacter fluvii TaxID=2838157 RepID=UPI001BDE45EC|nr:GH92 family glycosyl hydrolase [Flavihumibacter fluvii]ULQ51735.1 GH92 family glycosyl hydrolase [Flavihumibacter fluvii]
MTKIARLYFLLCMGFASFAVAQESKKVLHPSKWVDPQIGAVHGRWFFYTPASLPFGMAKLAPHTNAYGSKGGWQPCGYDDRQTSIEGFGHFHEFQIGGLVVMPVTGELQTMPGTLENPDAGYRSRFDKKSEHAEPGYYAVYLKDYQVKAELTATERVGFHRYTFPQSKDARIIFDVGHRQGESSDVMDAVIRLSGKKELEGSIETYPEYLKFCDPGKRVKMYFVIQLNKAPASYGTFVDSVVSPGRNESKGTGNGMFLNFSTAKNEIIEMRVGLSYTSIDNARKNLQAEASGQSFDAVRNAAGRKWEEKLGRIIVEGKDSVNKVKFYTGLYHALLGRGLASDINGQYPKNDGKIGQIPLDKNGKPKYHHYNTDGIWGAFWNLGQLWALVYPEYLSEYLQSNLDFAQETGWMHDGLAAGAHSNGVLTNFFGLMLAASYNCGIRDFNINQAYETAFKNETGYINRPFGSGKYDLSYLVKMGYIPSKDTVLSNGWVFNFGASHTLEFCFSSYAVSQFAKALGKKEDYLLLTKMAAGWKNLYDPETKFIRPKYENGTFIENFNPMQAWRGFQEGNAFQYTWYVPQDVAGLINVLGKDTFNARLEKTFDESQKSSFGGGKEINSFSGLEKLYNHGNQPCLHHAWLFNYSGKPWLTQKWTRAICDEFYGADPLHGYGYGQDEDQGQLGAWYVMAALGLFDVQGHASMNPTFQFGSPLFDKVTIKLNRKYYSGNTLVIETRNNDKQHVYIQSASFNNSKLNNCWIDRNKLTKGGVLVFELGAQPNMDFGINSAPPSMSTDR